MVTDISQGIAALDLHLEDDEIREPYTPHGPSWF